MQLDYALDAIEQIGILETLLKQAICEVDWYGRRVGSSPPKKIIFLSDDSPFGKRSIATKKMVEAVCKNSR